MSFRRNKKKLLAALGAVSVLVVAGVAVAYFTAGGSGTGTASVGTSTAFTIHGAAASTLYPGQSSQVDFTVDNTGSANQELGTISLTSVHACVGTGSTWNGTACSAGGTEETTCESFTDTANDTLADFSMANVVANQDFGQGNNQSVTAAGTLTMNDLATSQDTCKNANLTLGFSS